MSHQTYRTALCIIPPNYLWQPIQEIRQQHDPAYERWMPHINIVYPFINTDQFTDFALTLRNAFRKHNVQPINIKLNASNISHFDRKGNEFVMILLPNAETSSSLTQLYDIITSILPKIKDDNETNETSKHSRRPFTPHLTLGVFEDKNVTQTLSNFHQQWSQTNVGLPWTADSVFMIARHSDDTPFRILHEISFK